MSSEVVISVEGLGKCYRINHQAGGQRERYTALRDVIAEKAIAPWRRMNRWVRGQRSEVSHQLPGPPTSNLRPRAPFRPPVHGSGPTGYLG